MRRRTWSGTRLNRVAQAELLPPDLDDEEAGDDVDSPTIEELWQSLRGSESWFLVSRRVDALAPA